MYAIDTNVASELMRPAPAVAVAAWIAEQNAGDLVLTAISEAELRYGVAIVPAGRRRNELEAAMTRWLAVGFGGRILPFDSAAAHHYADIASAGAAQVDPSGRLTVRLLPSAAREALLWSRATFGTSRTPALR